MWPRPIAIDNSGLTPDITTSFMFIMFPLETDTPIEYLATDQAGNTGKCDFYVRIKGKDFVPQVFHFLLFVCVPWFESDLSLKPTT